MTSTLHLGRNIVISSDALGLVDVAFTRQELTSRYPGVRFHGSAPAARISPAVRIEAGASITLSSDLRITGNSKIGAGAIIEGGTIYSSTINGSVSGGDINHSTISSGSSISGGTVNHSTVRGHTNVTSGCINHCVLQSATVTGGILNHSQVRDNACISGGTLNHCVVNNDTTFSRGLRQHETIRDSNTRDSIDSEPNAWDYLGTNQVTRLSHGGFSNITIGGNSSVLFGDIITSPAHFSPPTESLRLHLPPPMEISNDTYNEDPPEQLIDHLISYDLIHEAVMTPNGDTFDRRVIEKHINAYGLCPVKREPLGAFDLRPNRALQAQITEWKATHAVQARSQL